MYDVNMKFMAWINSWHIFDGQVKEGIEKYAYISIFDGLDGRGLVFTIH